MNERRSQYAGSAPGSAVGAEDWRYMSLQAKCRDLLHLLSFADIKTPTEGDAEAAASVMASIRHFINTERAAPLPSEPLAAAASPDVAKADADEKWVFYATRCGYLDDKGALKSHDFRSTFPAMVGTAKAAYLQGWDDALGAAATQATKEGQL